MWTLFSLCPTANSPPFRPRLCVHACTPCAATGQPLSPKCVPPSTAGTHAPHTAHTHTGHLLIPATANANAGTAFSPLRLTTGHLPPSFSLYLCGRPLPLPLFTLSAASLLGLSCLSLLCTRLTHLGHLDAGDAIPPPLLAVATPPSLSLPFYLRLSPSLSFSVSHTHMHAQPLTEPRAHTQTHTKRTTHCTTLACRRW